LLKPELYVLFLLSRNRRRLSSILPPNTRCIQHGTFLFLRVIRGASVVGFSSLTAPQMFQIPWLLIMSIAAAWMYRSLQDFSSSDVYDTYLFLSSLSSLCVWLKLLYSDSIRNLAELCLHNPDLRDSGHRFSANSAQQGRCGATLLPRADSHVPDEL